MARKKSLQKLLEEYECDGQLSIFDLEDPIPEISKPLCFGSENIPFSCTFDTDLIVEVNSLG